MSKTRFLSVILFILNYSWVVAQTTTITMFGPSAVNSGSTEGYTIEFRNGSNQVIEPPSGTYVWHAYTGQVISSTPNSASIKLTFSGTVEYEMETYDNYYYTSLSVSVPITPDATDFTFVYNCGNTIVSRNGTPPAGVEWYWQTSDTGTSTALGASTSATLTSTSGLYLRARVISEPTVWSNDLQLIGNTTVYSSVSNAGTIGTSAEICSGATVTLTSALACGSCASYQWQYSLDNANWSNAAVNAGSAQFVVSPTTPTYYRRQAINPCGSGNSNTVVISVYTVLTPGSISGSQMVCFSKPLIPFTSTAPASSNTGTYQWQKRIGSGNWEDIPGSTNATYTPSYPTVSTDYRRKVSASCSTMYSNIITITVQDLNNVQSIDFLKEVTLSDPDLQGMNPNDYIQSIQYLDGLGRPMQAISTGNSPSEKDIVQPIVYDQSGLESVKYLPYVKTKSDGCFAAEAVADQSSFYQNINRVAHDTAPYSVTVFEKNPLNRVLKQGAPGVAWQPSGSDYSMTDHSIKKQYSVSPADSVILFSYNSSSGLLSYGNGNAINYYDANELFVTVTYDEKNNSVKEYTDKQGRVILKKVKESAAVYAETYYLYDDFGNLVVVLPPEGVAKLKANLN